MLDGHPEAAHSVGTCGAKTPAVFALACRSARTASSSVAPGLGSDGTTTSRMKVRVRWRTSSTSVGSVLMPCLLP
ncbi:hypothetical protein K4X33_01765 [Brevibacterium casei]|nr:hypothetical protein K4X33_01765 [Brevibacterium casei]